MAKDTSGNLTPGAEFISFTSLSLIAWSHELT